VGHYITARPRVSAQRRASWSQSISAGMFLCCVERHGMEMEMEVLLPGVMRVRLAG
jgi:hypothetical protein